MSHSTDIRRQAIQRLDALRRAGVTILPRHRGDVPEFALPPPPEIRQSPAIQRSTAEESDYMPRAKPPTPQPAANVAATKRASTSPAARDTSSPSSRGEGVQVAAGDSLDAIRREVAACTRCRELACTRTQTVFGVGDPRARLCFLGEAPGADEDRRGEPFVGRAGQLLDKIIEACTLRREDVYILNILKCRPPGNRNPEPAEAANCRPFLDRQLALIKPEFICCLGAVAARNLLATEESIGKMRGRTFDYHGIKVVCTYHPAYLLRNPSAKRDTWEDMQILMKLMGIDLPQR